MMEKEVSGENKSSGVGRQMLIFVGAFVFLVFYTMTLGAALVPDDFLPFIFGNREMAVVTFLGGVSVLLLTELINRKAGLEPWYYFRSRRTAMIAFIVVLAAATFWHIAGTFVQSVDAQIVFIVAPLPAITAGVVLYMLMQGAESNKQRQREAHQPPSLTRE